MCPIVRSLGRVWLCRLALLACSALPLAAHARDRVLHLDFAPVVAAALKDGQLDGSVKFYLEGQSPHGTVVNHFPEQVSNKKTNAFGKSDEESCDWVLRSVLIAFQESAKKQGANAVIGLASFYKKKVWTSSSKFECHAGTMMSGVAMKGRAAIVK